MNSENSKITAHHLARTAYLYVRQSTVRQVLENTESTQRQYDLRGRAVALGWPAERVVVIDSDLGLSGASSDRQGFQKLVADVGLGRAGIVLGLEVSRLARNSIDWHRLLEICALTETLIMDEDGLYDPSHFNDRLLLGLKGTMSEAELHLLRARMRGALVSKARRGELSFRLPIGYVHDPLGRIVFDPDVQVQTAVRLVFTTFARLGSACATTKYFLNENILFPRRLTSLARAGEIILEPLAFARTLDIVRHPIYAGAYVFGKSRSRRLPDGRTQTRRLPREEWLVLKRDAHPAFISWEEHERIQQRLLEGSRVRGADRRHGPAREGCALLQGLVVCGRCGRRMATQYHARVLGTKPSYVCLDSKHLGPACQTFLGPPIDSAIGALLVAQLTPVALETALAVSQEIQARLDEADALRRQQVQRAQFESDLSRRRFLQVDPENRLVAQTLEADWNHKLRLLAEAREVCEKARAADRASLDEEKRARILALVSDFPALWNDPATPHRERKRMLALLVEDVTLTRQKNILLQIRFRGGATTELTVPAPLTAAERFPTPRSTVAQLDALLETHTAGQAAVVLNERGLTPGVGEPFSTKSVAWLCHTGRIAPRAKRLRRQGMFTTKELASKLAVGPSTIRVWRSKGILKGQLANDRDEWMCYLSENTPDRIPAAGSSDPVGTPADRLREV